MVATRRSTNLVRAATTSTTVTSTVKRTLSPPTPTSAPQRLKLESPPPELSPSTALLLKSEAVTAEHQAEEEGVLLLHPEQTFDYEAAKAHLISIDGRWKGVMSSMVCKPFEGEMTEGFNPFKSLVTSIVGQQVSWLAARSITHRFVRLFFPHLPLKLPAVGEPVLPSLFPTPSQVLALTDPTTELRSAGLSGRKVEYVIELATRFHDGRLNAKELWGMTEEEVMKELCAIRGIGVWTVHMFLIFSMKRGDIMPWGDLGIQKNLLKWYTSDPNEPTPIDPRKLAKAKVTKSIKESKSPPRETTPPPSSTGMPTTPSTKIEATDPEALYPTPLTPSNSTSTMLPNTLATPSSAPTQTLLKPQGVDEKKPSAHGIIIPPTTSKLTHAILKHRLSGNKIKGNIYLTPLEMEELSVQWKPYRSVACWYLWSITDGTGDA